MARKKYGVMPEQPESLRFVQLKGDAGIYEVRAIDWVKNNINIYRAMDYEWHSIDKVAFVEPEKNTER